MSILIKGIELPEKVQVLELHSDGKVFTRKGYLVGEAVELPDHHGRLVDADALIADCQLAQKQADRHGREFANAFYSGGGEISTEWWCVEDMIENAPTIVEAEGET